MCLFLRGAGKGDAALEDYLRDARPRLLRGDREEKALFVNYYGQRITRQGLWKILKEYGKQAGLEHKLTPNVIRNSFAVHMIQNGADLKSLQELLGHEDISATQIYPREAVPTAKAHIFAVKNTAGCVKKS